MTAVGVAPTTRNGLRDEGSYKLACHVADCAQTLVLTLPQPLRDLSRLELGYLIEAHGWCSEPVRCAAHVPTQAEEALSLFEQNQRLQASSQRG